ncbi:YdeI/OmpD-associated family protein [Oscillatoria sp. CS-180]|uniref:YdeI/OmpD-associated family protein n=1 Tax=Oscillatoria sp. CS-180 TaxID=3021720 RepID=UPI00232EF411|nr:YdeI/OmpD-associated family protein [Oscillatoria sp. CS-180]MDB9527200.1 YdeI/OmpD-associated family protein [Oscillatoria sp. CS-180]
MAKELEKVAIKSAAELREWLSQNHSSSGSVWLVTWKKDSDHPYVSYDEIVDHCLCYGWVDSLPRKLDELRTMLRISPHSPKSNWSRVNKDRVSRLVQEGLMEPEGLAVVEQAKKNGTWDFLDDVERLEVPEDLHLEFEKHPGSRRLFERFPPSSRRGILEWIKTAKTEITRRKRIAETVRKAAVNRKANFPKGRDAGPEDELTSDTAD